MPYTDDGIGHSNNDTSLAAVNPEAQLPMRERVFAALTAAWPRGMNASEVAKAVGRKHYYGIQPRLSELKNSGRVYDSGIRRPLHTGRMGIVWRINCR